MDFNIDNLDLTKLESVDFATYLDTTPNGATATYGLLGIGITALSTAYNPQATTEKWIINRNANTEVDSVQKQSEVSQKMYKGDPCFDFGYSVCGKTGTKVKTRILDIDIWDEVSEGKFKAELSDGRLVVTTKNKGEATLEYTLYYNGDPVEGTVTFNAEGKPTFTPTEIL